MNSYRKHLVSSISFLILLSCSSESTGEIAQIKAPIDPSSQASISENSDTIKEFELASNELEYKTIKLYENKYMNMDLSSVVNGMVQSINPNTNKVYLETKLSTKRNSLSFFEDKYPEFLKSELNNVKQADSILLINTKVSSKTFESISAKEFLNDRSRDNSGDLLLISSCTFYKYNAYFVHVWEISNGKGVFVVQRKTFKYNKEKTLIDYSFMNYAFKAQSGIQSFLDSL